MALTASPPPSDLSPQHQELSDQLDESIARVRAEIESLTQRKTLLVSTLLSSTRVQSRLASYDAQPQNGPVQPADEQTPLQTHIQHNQTNIHRLAYGVTSFPFTDPNLGTSNHPLLGIRFDIPGRTGTFEQTPYYVFLKRVNGRPSQQRENESSSSSLPQPIENGAGSSDDTNLRIHHHTIPALVPLQDYEARYLPLPAAQSARARDEGYFSPSPANDDDNDNDNDNNEGGDTATATIHNDDSDASTPTQNLHGFVAAVRHDLVSWQLRRDAISLLSEELGLSDPVPGSGGGDGEKEKNKNKNNKAGGRFLVQSVEATAVDARFCRLVWDNGTVGRLRLTDDGHVDRAVVIGDVGVEGQLDRMRGFERILTTARDGTRLNVSDLLTRLEAVEKKMQGGMEIDGQDL